MSADQTFSMANTIALVAWVLLAAMPRQRWVSTVTALAVPALLASAYTVIIGMSWRTAAGDFSSLAGVAALFANPSVLLAGWLHYLAFDLLVGHWEVRDARERGIPHLLVVPCLALTFFFGPAGWLLYNGVRLAYRRS